MIFMFLKTLIVTRLVFCTEEKIMTISNKKRAEHKATDEMEVIDGVNYIVKNAS